MKRLLSIAVALAAFGTVSAQGADLGVRPYTKAPALAPVAVYDWSGFYIGGNVGYGWGRTHTDQFDANGVFLQSGTINRGGIIGGGQIGYNWQFAPNWVLGIEADISGADLKSTVEGCSATGCSTTSSKLDYFGTVRGRLGYAINNVLLYGTGGLLWAHSSTDRTITAVTNPRATSLVGQVAGSSSSPTGWTAGGGIEWGFAPNWSAKVEYLYGELKTSSDFRYVFTNNNPDRHFESKTQLNAVRVGVNYRFGGPAITKY